MSESGRPFRPRYEDARFGALVTALEIVAADADEQEPALSALRSVADAIRRGEPMSALGREISEATELPGPVADRIARIDKAFDGLLARPDDVFRDRGLFDDPLFCRMRILAREALDELGLPRRRPPLPPRMG